MKLSQKKSLKKFVSFKKQKSFTFSQDVILFTNYKNNLSSFETTHKKSIVGYSKQHNTFLCRYALKGKNLTYPDGTKIQFNLGEQGVTTIKRNRGIMNSNSSNMGKSKGKKPIDLKMFIGKDIFKSGLIGLLKPILGEYIEE